MSRLDRAINSHCHVQEVGKGAARVALHSETGSFCAVRVQRREHNCFLPGSFPRKSFPFRATQCYTESWKICGKSEMQQTCRNQRTGHPIEPSWDQVAVLSPMSSFPPGRDAPPPPNVSLSLDPGEVGSGGPKLGCVAGGVGSRPFVGREVLAWGCPAVCSTLQPSPSGPDWVYPVRGHHGGTHR